MKKCMWQPNERSFRIRGERELDGVWLGPLYIEPSM